MLVISGEKVAILRSGTLVLTTRAIVILIGIVVISACGQNHYRAPVTDMIQPPSRKVSTHIVASGETLYSIAWRYDLDYASLARVNNIGPGYRIYPGQVLNLNVESRKPWTQPSEVKPGPEPAVRKPPATNPSATEEVKNLSRSKNETSSIKLETNQSNSSQPLVWQWPIKGKILTDFRGNNGLQKGIDIKGKLGDAVLAASTGVVVYSGDGLRGYGKLLIVKHNDTYLSAYAHNRRLLVTEGDVVQAGQKIAEVGSTGTNTDKLYFEIRRDGKPVNPLLYLPKN